MFPEGNDVGGGGSDLSINPCKTSCNENPRCKSISYCPKSQKKCFLKDRKLTGNEKTKSTNQCTTYLKIDSKYNLKHNFKGLCQVQTKSTNYE